MHAVLPKFRFGDRRFMVATAVAVLAATFAALQLRHGVTPLLDTASYWSGIVATRSGHPFTTTLAASFSNFDVVEVLQHGGRLPFVDFPVGYPLLAGVVSLFVGARNSMIVVTVAATFIMVFVGVLGARSRPVTGAALVVRSVLMFGVAAMPVFRLSVQGALSEPLFCAAAICFVAALVEYRDQARSWVLPAVLVAVCGLFRFVGVALVVLLVLEMWRRRETLRRVATAVAVATGSTFVNIVSASAAGGGHRAGWRGLHRDDLTTLARSIGGWWNSRLGDLRLTYFATDRSLGWWVWVIVVVWFIAVGLACASAAGLAPRRLRLPDELTICLGAAGLLVAALIAGMAGFDSLVIADNRLMLPAGMLTVVAVGWSVRSVGRRSGAAAVAAAVLWLLVATGPTNWSESFSTPTSAGALDPATLPNGRTVAVVLSNDADSLHWASGVPAAYLPFATSSLTGEAVDIAVLYEQLPCALDRYDGLVVISSTSLFGEGAVAELARLVDDGRLVRLPSRLGVAYAASATCAG